MLTVRTWPVGRGELAKQVSRPLSAWHGCPFSTRSLRTQPRPDMMDNVVPGVANTNIWPGWEEGTAKNRDASFLATKPVIFQFYGLFCGDFFQCRCRWFALGFWYLSRSSILRGPRTCWGIVNNFIRRRRRPTCCCYLSDSATAKCEGFFPHPSAGAGLGLGWGEETRRRHIPPLFMRHAQLLALTWVSWRPHSSSMMFHRRPPPCSSSA